MDTAPVPRLRHFLDYWLLVGSVPGLQHGTFAVALAVLMGLG